MFSFITKLFSKKPESNSPLTEGNVRNERKPSSLNPQKPKRNPPVASSQSSPTDCHVQNTYMFTDVIDDSSRRSSSDCGPSYNSGSSSSSYDCGSSSSSYDCGSSSSE